VLYQAEFVAGARAHHNISIDYIGIWNERPWGNAEYIKKLRDALDAVGAQSTAIVGSDAVRYLPTTLLTALGDDAGLSSIVAVAGVHYACNRTVPQSFWSLKVVPLSLRQIILRCLLQCA
jgi:galactosylceramidase